MSNEWRSLFITYILKNIRIRSIAMNYVDCFHQSLDRLMSIPVKHTLKRPLNDKEIEQIASKRFKELETDFTADDFFTENGAEMIPEEE